MELCPYCRHGYIQTGVCPRCRHTVKDGNRPLPAGTLLNGRYVLERPLGSGGFGITYQAWDRTDARWTAVKELFPLDTAFRREGGYELVKSRERGAYFRYAFSNFVRETETLRKLSDHPEVLKVYDAFEQFGTAYYAMEYLEGEDLKSVMGHEGPLPWERLEQPIRDVIGALEILHAHDLIHRDISPDNIFLTKNGKTKLIDFGSVRNFDISDHFTTVIKGAFSPAELFLENGNQGPWTDVFLLCATLYFLLSGVIPKHIYDRISSNYLHHTDSLTPLSQLAPKAPGHVVRAVARGLDIEIAHRFSSMQELSEALFPHPPSGEEGAVHTQALFGSGGHFRGQTFPLKPEQYVHVGRESGNTIRYPGSYPGVSRYHGCFYASREGQVYFQDLNSSFGSSLDQVPLTPNRWYAVRPNQKIRIGNGSEELQLVIM